MSDIKTTYLQGFTAIEILMNVYPDTLAQAVLDLQKQINDCRRWKDKPEVPGNKLSDKEVYELDKEISEKTIYVKSLLEFYAAYNHPRPEIHNLCKFYAIKTFRDK